MEEAAKILKRCDLDDDGSIDFNEFMEWFKKTAVAMARFQRGVAAARIHDRRRQGDGVPNPHLQVIIQESHAQAGGSSAELDAVVEQEKRDQEAEVSERRKKDWDMGQKKPRQDLTLELSATEMYRKYVMDCTDGGRAAAAEADEEARKEYKEEMKRKEKEWFEQKKREEEENRRKEEAVAARRLYNLQMLENEEGRAKAARVASQKAKLKSQSEKTRLATQRKMRCNRNEKEWKKKREEEAKTKKKREEP